MERLGLEAGRPSVSAAEKGRAKVVEAVSVSLNPEKLGLRHLQPRETACQITLLFEDIFCTIHPPPYFFAG